jgi:hypothetical protein
MRCWIGGEEAEGVCRFCGRAVCRAHAQTRAFLYEAWEHGGQLRGLGIEDALYCGQCKVNPHPVDVTFLRRGLALTPGSEGAGSSERSS